MLSIISNTQKLLSGNFLNQTKRILIHQTSLITNFFLNQTKKDKNKMIQSYFIVMQHAEHYFEFILLFNKMQRNPNMLIKMKWISAQRFYIGPKRNNKSMKDILFSVSFLFLLGSKENTNSFSFSFFNVFAFVFKHCITHEHIIFSYYVLFTFLTFM